MTASSAIGNGRTALVTGAKTRASATPPPRVSAASVSPCSSELAIASAVTTPGSKYQGKPLLGYNSAKSALNSVTVQFANEFRGSALKINAADPGYVRTDMTRNDGTRLPDKGAAVVIRLATLPEDGPTGAFFDDHGVVPW